MFKMQAASRYLNVSLDASPMTARRVSAPRPRVAFDPKRLYLMPRNRPRVPRVPGKGGVVVKEESLGLQVLVARLLCWSLVGFDALLGGLSMFAPKVVMKLFAPGAEPEGASLLRRAAAIWLFFIPVQVWAAVKAENPRALRTVSILRLQEVPADPIWLATGKGFGIFGKFGLVFAPIFNLVAGSFLWRLADQLENACVEEAAD